MSVSAQLEAIALGERAEIGPVLIERFSLFGFRLWPALDVLDAAELATRLEDSGGAAPSHAARDQTQGKTVADLDTHAPATCARPSPLGLQPEEGAAEGVRWHAARAGLGRAHHVRHMMKPRGDVHVVLDERVQRSNGQGRRAWLREQGQAVCKPRGFRKLERVDVAPTCTRCLREAKERGIALKGAT